MRMPGGNMYPLTEEMMRRGLQGADAEHMLGKFEHMIGKLTRGESVHLAVIGGSFAHNAPAREKNKDSFLFMFCDWLRHSYPAAASSIHCRNFAISSTRSENGMHFMNEIIDRHYDLMFVAYAANDNGDFGVTDQILIATEFIIRSLLKKKTALIYISENIDSDHAEKAYLRVTSYYHVPVLSYRNATVDHIRAHPPPRTNVFWMGDLSNPHPPNSVHQLICDMCAYFFTTLVEYQHQHRSQHLHQASPQDEDKKVEGEEGEEEQKKENDVIVSPADSSWTLPKKLFVDSEDICGHSTSMSSLPMNNATSPFLLSLDTPITPIRGITRVDYTIPYHVISTTIIAITKGPIALYPTIMDGRTWSTCLGSHMDGLQTLPHERSNHHKHI